MESEDEWQLLATHGWKLQDNPASLLNYFKHLVNIYPDSARARFELANALDYLSREEEAVTFYREALALGLSREYEIYAKVQLASSIHNLGRAEEAVGLLKEVTERDPHHLSFVIFLALALRTLGRCDEALQRVIHGVLRECHTPDLIRYYPALTQYADALYKPKQEEPIDPESLVIRLRTDSDPLPWNLLLQADPCAEMVQSYCQQGFCYLAEWKETIVGVYVILGKTEDRAELMNISVVAEWQGQGIGRQLLQHAQDVAKELGYVWLEVGTGNSSLSQLRFYQRAGFRITGVLPDFFVHHYAHPIVEEDIPCRDMIRLTRRLDFS